jgi:hypothetical protein
MVRGWGDTLWSRLCRRRRREQREHLSPWREYPEGNSRCSPRYAREWARTESLPTVLQGGATLCGAHSADEAGANNVSISPLWQPDPKPGCLLPLNLHMNPRLRCPFSLSPREERAGREPERGAIQKVIPPLPVPLLPPASGREGDKSGRFPATGLTRLTGLDSPGFNPVNPVNPVNNLCGDACEKFISVKFGQVLEMLLTRERHQRR